MRDNKNGERPEARGKWQPACEPLVSCLSPLAFNQEE